MNQISGRFIAEAPTIGPIGAAAQAVPAWTGDFHRLRLRLYLFMIAADGLLMAASFLLANVAYFHRPFASYGVNTLALLFPLYLAIGLNGGTWSLQALESSRRSVGLATQSLLFAIAVATFVLFTFKIGQDFSRVVFGLGSILSLLMIAAARARFGEAIGRRCGWTFRREVLIVDGVAATAPGAELVVDARREELRPSIDDPSMLDRLGRLLAGSERVILACPAERRAAWSRMLAGANVDVELLSPDLDRLGAIGLRRHAGRATILVGCGPLGLRQRALKRAFDLVVSVPVLLLLLPLLTLVAAAIRLDSPGPVLFRQPRMGRGNRLFGMLKFRTMRAEATDTAGDRSTARDDDRITRVGRLLRRTSLDELPQLLNVLSGEMSLVGPRPHALGSTAEDAPFWLIEERYWDRHAIKPGMTGLAQIRGYRGATACRSDVTNRLQADLEYLDGWSLGRDISILVRTLNVLVHRNAY
ncbi:sugar transferase [Sphingosinicella terrae]|uniref:sugar transferase n=1 Tax=Sphingosinicella terrae TaxID=2172047 RepID=UPI000E0DC594|nr:sugar transferase [Sphingosinicella terrae]